MRPKELLKRFLWRPYLRARIALVRLLERREGIDSAGEVLLEDIGLDDEGRGPYRPSGWRLLYRAVPRSSVGPDDVLLDLGSGKGRVVYQAAKDYPFRRIVGVELSEELNQVARRNLELNRDALRCRDVEIVTADALTYDFPDDVTVVYMYNPFSGDVFTGAIERLLASYDRRPRPIRIIYANPVEHERLEATGRVRLVARRPPLWRPTAGWRRSDTVYEYELGPAAESATAPPSRLVLPFVTNPAMAEQVAAFGGLPV